MQVRSYEQSGNLRGSLSLLSGYDHLGCRLKLARNVMMFFEVLFPWSQFFFFVAALCEHCPTVCIWRIAAGLGSVEIAPVAFIFCFLKAGSWQSSESSCYFVASTGIDVEHRSVAFVDLNRCECHWAMYRQVSVSSRRTASNHGSLKTVRSTEAIHPHAISLHFARVRTFCTGSFCTKSSYQRCERSSPDK